MFPARDIVDLLQARASSGRQASRIVEAIFAKIVVRLRRDPRFAGVSPFEFDLLLADISSEAEKVLFAELRDRIALHDAEHAVHQCLGEEDEPQPSQNRRSNRDHIPADWYMPITYDNGEPGYLLTREGVVMVAMWSDGRVATQAKVEIAQIISGWYRGEIFPRSAAPTVAKLLDYDSKASSQPLGPRAPIEIAGGVSGLQKHLVQLAEKNRGLDHAALKQLFDEYQVVIAVWQTEDKVPGPGFLTLKGTEYLLAQAKRGPKKIRATMTAFWANSREHAEILQQAFVRSADCGGLT
jgi:hypothetical protein